MLSPTALHSRSSLPQPLFGTAQPSPPPTPPSESFHTMQNQWVHTRAREILDALPRTQTPRVSIPAETGLSDVAVYGILKEKGSKSLAPEEIALLFLPPRPLVEPVKQKLITAIAAALEGANKVVEYWPKETGAQYKGGNTSDVLNIADIEANEAIMGTIQRLDTESEILSEEAQDDVKKADGRYELHKTWVIDPIDGSLHFEHRFNDIGVSVAYAEDGVPQVAALVTMPDGKLYIAARDNGAWHQGQRISTSTTDDITRGLFTSYFPKLMKDCPQVSYTNNNISTFLDMNHASQGARINAAIPGGVAVARGAMEGFWQRSTNIWDVIGLDLLIKEAGRRGDLDSHPSSDAVITDLEGKPLDYHPVGPISLIMAANHPIYTQMKAHIPPDVATFPNPQPVS